MVSSRAVFLFVTIITTLIGLRSNSAWANDLQLADNEVVKLFSEMPKEVHLAASCLACHKEKLSELEQSIHGKAGLLSQHPPGAICLTCHEINHRSNKPISIEKNNLDFSHALPKERACMKCHGSEALAAQFGFSPHVPSEFEESMHYRKVTIGEKKAPLCFDCHGAHNVQSMQAPNSLKNSPAERAKVCSKCHRGSNETFAMTFDHRPTTWEEKPLQYAVIAMFKTLTLGTFVGLGLFMLLDISSLIRCIVFRKKMGLHAHHKPKKVEYVERLTASQRWQHFFMLSSVLTLVVTGWPLFSPESETSIAVMNLLGGAGTVAIIHRTAGLVMIADFLYHLYYLFTLFRKGGKILAFPMLPTPKDVIDAWGLILFFFGLRKDKPAFKQFAFFEKFDYWAVFWGVAMMGFSGLMLMFPTVVTRVLPSWSVSLSEIIHADESLLAGVVLIIWHFYNVHFKPGIFPMNWAWLSGKMPKHHYEEEHAAHVEELKKEGKWKE